MAAGVPEVVAVGVNCCAPTDVLNAVRVARSVGGKPIVVYPNSGENGTEIAAPGRGLPGYSGDLAARWVAEGARIVVDAAGSGQPI